MGKNVIMANNNDLLKNTGDKSKDENNDNEEQNEINDTNGDEKNDTIRIKLNDVTHENSQISLKSKINVIEKSQKFPSTSVNLSHWKSTNPFVNYMQDCRKQRRTSDRANHENFFRFAATQWRLMSHEKKQFYINGAAIIKKQKLLNTAVSTSSQKRKKTGGKTTMKKKNETLKKNNKKMIKQRERKKIRKHRLFKNGSESDSASDNSFDSSGTGSIISDEII